MDAKIIFDSYFYVGKLGNKFLKSAFEETWCCFKTEYFDVCFRKILSVYISRLNKCKTVFEMSDHRSTAVSLQVL